MSDFHRIDRILLIFVDFYRFFKIKVMFKNVDEELVIIFTRILTHTQKKKKRY